MDIGELYGALNALDVAFVKRDANKVATGLREGSEDLSVVMASKTLTGGISILGVAGEFHQTHDLSEAILIGSNTKITFDQEVVITSVGAYQHTMIRTGNAEFSAAAYPIPGVSIYCADEQTAGAGSMRYTVGTTSLAWKAPEDSGYGAEVDISGVTNAATVAIFKLASATAGKAIYVYVAPATRTAQTNSVNVAGVTGAKPVTWSRISNVTTVSEAAHIRRVGDFVILFNAATAMRHGYISAVTASTWTIADTGVDTTGSASAYGVRNIVIEGNGATLDYNKGALPTTGMSNLHAIVILAASDVDVSLLQVNNCTKYACLITGYKNVKVDGFSAYRTASDDLSGNSDVIHPLGPGVGLTVNHVRAQGGDNIVGIGCADYYDYVFNCPTYGSLSIDATEVDMVICENTDEQPIRIYNANGSNWITNTTISNVVGTYGNADACVAVIMDTMSGGMVDSGQTNVDGLYITSPNAVKSDGTRSYAFVSRGAGTRRNYEIKRLRPRAGNSATVKSTVSIDTAVDNMKIQIEKADAFTGYIVGLLTGASVADLEVTADFVTANHTGLAGFPAVVALDTATSSITRLRIKMVGDDTSTSGQKLIGVYNNGILGKVTFDNCTMLDGDSLLRLTTTATAGTVIEGVNTKVTTSYGFATEVAPASLELTNFSHLGGAGAILHNTSTAGTIKVKAANVVASNRFLRNAAGNTVYQVNARQLEAVIVLVSDAGTPSWRLQSPCDFSIDGALLDATVGNHGAGASFYNTNAAYGAGIGAYVRGSAAWTRVAA